MGVNNNSDALYYLKQFSEKALGMNDGANDTANETFDNILTGFSKFDADKSGTLSDVEISSIMNSDIFKNTEKTWDKKDLYKQALDYIAGLDGEEDLSLKDIALLVKGILQDDKHSDNDEEFLKRINGFDDAGAWAESILNPSETGIEVSDGTIETAPQADNPVEPPEIEQTPAPKGDKVEATEEDENQNITQSVQAQSTYSTDDKSVQTIVDERMGTETKQLYKDGKIVSEFKYNLKTQEIISRKKHAYDADGNEIVLTSDKNGTLLSQRKYKQDGTMFEEIIYKNNNISYRSTYNDEDKSESAEYYDNSGNLYKTVSYKNGKKTEEFEIVNGSGEIRYYNASGNVYKTWTIENIENIQEFDLASVSGEMRYYNALGNAYKIATYKNGKRTKDFEIVNGVGKTKFYDENGKEI